MSVVVDPLAIPFALLSNFLVMLGYTLQKKAAERLPRIEDHKLLTNLRNFFTSPLWLLGTLSAVLSFPTTFLAYSLGNISLVNSLAGSGLIFLALLSWIINKEQLSINELFSYCIIGVGVIISGYYSSFTVTQEDFDVLWNLTVTIRGLVFFVIFIAIISGGIIVLNMQKLQQKDGLILAFVGGIAMALAIICLKGASMVLSHFHFTHLLDYRPWVFFVVYATGALSGTILLQMAYQRERALQVVPIYHNLVHVIPIIYGGVVLFEWAYLSTISKVLLIIGIFIVSFGISSLAFTSSKNKKL